MSKKVFLVRPDALYGSVNPSNDDYDSNLESGKKLSDWKVVDWYYSKKKFKKGDFFYFNGSIGFQPSGLNSLVTYFEKFGQLLPINIEGVGERQVFNVTKFNDCFNFDHSLFRNKDVTERYTIEGKEAIAVFDNINDINRVLFEKDACLNSDKINSPLFYTWDRVHFMGPYVTSGFFDSAEELYHIVHDKDLKGLIFTEVNII